MTTEPGDDQSRAGRLRLWFEQFRDLALIELALAGGIITLLGTVFNESPNRGRAMTAVALFGVGAVAALVGQAHVVDLSDTGKVPDRTLHRLRLFSLVLLGAGGGAFAMFTLGALGLR